MVTLSHLFSSTEEVIGLDLELKSALNRGIDVALERGECDRDVLHIMKELLIDLGTPSVSDYVREVNNG